MRINRIEITNFKAISNLALELHPEFNLLVGINGAGKTSILNAMSVAMAIWLVEFRTKETWRNISEWEIRRRVIPVGDTVRFVPEPFAEIGAVGTINGELVRWKRMIREGGTRTTNAEADEALKLLRDLKQHEREDPSSVVLPILAYYGAGRLEQTSRKRREQSRGRERLDAYYHCFDGNIRHDQLNKWFLGAQSAAGVGRALVGHKAVREAVINCLPGCREIWHDSERNEIVADLRGTPIPYYNLSAGQRMMLGMVADIAIKAETLNPQLGADMVTKTPGIVLIDELDVHLHPAWQRSVVHDLKNTFRSIQFVCTTHSPQIFGELAPENIQVFNSKTREWKHPDRSLGLDSSRILTEEMEARDRNVYESKLLHDLALAIDAEQFQKAQDLLEQVIGRLGEDDPEVTRARTLMTFLKESL
jgi:predicted ATP-binding protein involved in virulence